MSNYVYNILYSDSTCKIFESAITCVSILLGFSGSLISQILSAKNDSIKNKEKNLITFFFSKANKNKEFSNYINSSIFNCIMIIIFSLIMLTNYAMGEETRFYLFYAWTVSIFSFLGYEVLIYTILIRLLFENEAQQEIVYNRPESTELDESIKKISENIKSNKNN